MRVLDHIKKLDDCFGQFLVRVICDCGAVREIEPEVLEVREESRRDDGGCEAQAVGSAEESSLMAPLNGS